MSGSERHHRRISDTLQTVTYVPDRERDQTELFSARNAAACSSASPPISPIRIIPSHKNHTANFSNICQLHLPSSTVKPSHFATLKP